MHKLVIDFWKLTRSWWNVDRIRVSPREGRLLRLQPPCYLLIDGRPAEVLARTLAQGDSGWTVSYECRTADGDGNLTVRMIGDSTSDVVWTTDGVERLIASDEIEVFVPTRR
jgi:hypothetical protein